MAILVYDIGELVRIAGTFTDINGDLADPSTVTLEVEGPTGQVITYDYQGSPEEVTRTAVGVYHVDVDVIAAGDWHYRWSCTGVSQAAEPGQFMVQPKRVGA